MVQPYAKPFLTVAQQAGRLRERGLDIGSADYAESLLRRIGYYRLSGYWYLFREPDPSGDGVRRSTFASGSSLRTVHQIYDFDRALRMRVFDALEMVEVALRFRIGHLLGRDHVYAHRDPTYLLPSFTGQDSQHPALSYSRWLDSDHAGWLREVNREESRSSETFVEHVTAKYGGPLPIWVATEIMSFGTLSRLFSGMPSTQKNRIAAAFGIVDAVPNGDGSLAGNWLNHLRYIRNTCAHHARLWNKNLTVQLAEPRGIPELAHLSDPATRTRVYGTLAVLSYLTERIHPGCGWREATFAFVRSTAESLDLQLSQLGFPEDPADLDLWKSTYVPSRPDLAGKQEVLDQIGTMSSTEAGALLRPDERPAKRGSWLRYLRTRRRLLGLRLASSYEYPRFQLDPSTGDVYPIVATANARLLLDPRSATPEQVDSAEWAAARWWVTPSGPGESSPQELVDAGDLDPARLDSLLPVAPPTPRA